MAAFAAAIAAALVTPPFRVGTFVRELRKLESYRVIIIVVCGLSGGDESNRAAGVSHAGGNSGAQQSLQGSLVGLSLIRELGPVITALLVTGQAGSATAAEIGSMVATEQLDGLRMLSIDPVRLVVMPKSLGMAFVMPLLTSIFILCGLYGGYIVGVGLMGGLIRGYIWRACGRRWIFRNDIAASLLKSVIFGILVGLIATYQGYNSQPNAEGVSSATTSTVVIGSVVVLLSDYVITALWGV